MKKRSVITNPPLQTMNTLLKPILAALGLTLLSAPMTHAQNWGSGGNYSQTVSGIDVTSVI